MFHYTNNQTHRQPNHHLTTSYFEESLNAVALKTNSQTRIYGNGYRLRCPAHDDCNPSLSMSEGDDGKILIYCYAGCTAKEICSAMGWSLSALFPRKKQWGTYGRRK